MGSNLIRNSIDESTSEVGVSEENLAKQPSFSSSDIDDYKPVSIVFNQRDDFGERSMAESHQAYMEVEPLTACAMNEEDDGLLIEDSGGGGLMMEGFCEFKLLNKNVNNLTLPNNYPDDLVSVMKKTAIRRHHSAPQSEAKWLQVQSCIHLCQNCCSAEQVTESLK